MFKSWFLPPASSRGVGRDPDGDSVDWKPPTHLSTASSPRDAHTRRQSPSSTRSSPSAPRTPRRRSAEGGAAPALERQEAQLQRRLQYYLDAQSDALLDGAGGGAREAHTHMHTGSNKVVPVRQPPTRSLGLREAREGIRTTLLELGRVKREQAAVLQAASESNAEDLAKITSWEAKRGSLQSEIEAITSTGENDRVGILEGENTAIEEQIAALEMQLEELRAKHRVNAMEIASLQNSVQSKLSSYNASLSLLDKDIDDFLARPRSRQGVGIPHAESYLSLPRKRRTLEMAREHILDDERAAHQRRDLTVIEIQALDQGTQVWKEVVGLVEEFESRLSRQIQILGQSTTQSHGEDHADDAERLITRLDEILDVLEKRLKLSEDQNWKLLICCIGAEYQAFKQGREILTSLLQPAAVDSGEAPSPTRNKVVEDVQEDDEILTSVQRLERRAKGSLSGPQPSVEDNDDEPDDDLLVSKHDTDTE